MYEVGNVVEFDISSVATAALDAHETEKATDAVLGHVTVDNTTITASDGIISSYFQGVTGEKYKVVAGVLKADGAGNWSVIDDAGHSPMFTGTISIVSGKIRIGYDFTANKIKSFILAPDDILAAQGLLVGGDVGLSYANVAFYKVIEEVSGFVAYDGSDWTITTPKGDLEYVSFTAGALKLSHRSLLPITFDITANAFGGGYSPQITNVAADYVEIGFYDSSGTLVTTADTGMKCLFSRRAKNQSINPADTSLFTGASGHNIFFQGIFEV